MAPNMRFGKRSSTPSNTKAAMVCHTASGMLMNDRPVKFSSPPWKSFTFGSPVSM